MGAVLFVDILGEGGVGDGGVHALFGRHHPGLGLVQILLFLQVEGVRGVHGVADVGDVGHGHEMALEAFPSLDAVEHGLGVLGVFNALGDGLRLGQHLVQLGTLVGEFLKRKQAQTLLFSFLLDLQGLL